MPEAGIGGKTMAGTSLAVEVTRRIRLSPTWSVFGLAGVQDSSPPYFSAQMIPGRFSAPGDLPAAEPVAIEMSLASDKPLWAGQKCPHHGQPPDDDHLFQRRRVRSSEGRRGGGNAVR